MPRKSAGGMLEAGPPLLSRVFLQKGGQKITQNLGGVGVKKKWLLR